MACLKVISFIILTVVSVGRFRLFRTLEIPQLQQSRVHLFRKNTEICRNSDLCHVSTCPISILHSKAMQQPQIQAPVIMMKTNNLAVMGEVRMVLKLSQSYFPRELSLLTCLIVPLKTQPARESLNDLTQNFLSANSLFLESNC